MFDDERDFWADEPTRSFDRISSRSTRPRPALQRRHATSSAGGRRRGAGYVGVDPFLLRLGLMIGAVVLIVPGALSLRADSGTNILRTAPGVGAVALPAPAAPASLTLPAASAPSTEEPAATPAPSADPTSSSAAVLDPASLPPAIPAVDVAAADSSSSTSGSSTSGTSSNSTTAPTATQDTEAKATTPACSREYDVVAGDYWILIAQKVSVSTSELLAVNGATAATALYPGRSICLPDGASTPTTAPAMTAAEPTSATAAPKATSTTTAPKAPTTTAAPSITAAPTTTQAPTTTTTPQRTYSRTEVELIIRAVWPDDLEDEAVRIATRESNLQPTAKNFCCYGLFQIYYSVHQGWLAGIGVTSAAQLFDPLVNANAALTLYYRAGGWGPWGF